MVDKGQLLIAINDIDEQLSVGGLNIDDRDELIRRKNVLLMQLPGYDYKSHRAVDNLQHEGHCPWCGNKIGDGDE